MVLSRVGQIVEFFRVYVLDWHVLSALLIPLLFGLFFPLYWFVICPLIWSTDPGLFRPRSWIIGYWLFASLVWFIFLAICLYHMRSGHQMALRGSCGLRTSDSTEDIWNEDKYIPETYLPTPEYFVSITAVQPSVHLDPERHLEAKQELDETWDYNYEEQHQFRKFKNGNKVSDLNVLPTNKKCPENSKRKFSNFLACPSNSSHKSQEHFDLSSDEEEHQGKWPSIFGGQKCPTLTEESTIDETQEQHHHHHTVTITATCVANVNGTDVASADVGTTEEPFYPTIMYERDRLQSDASDATLERKDSTVSDAKFDLILASLQSLAIEIERDFRSDFDSKFGAQRTKSESNLSTSKSEKKK